MQINLFKATLSMRALEKTKHKETKGRGTLLAAPNTTTFLIKY